MTTTTAGPDPEVLRSGLVATTLRDEARLRRRLAGAERAKGPRRAAQLARWPTISSPLRRASPRGRAPRAPSRSATPTCPSATGATTIAAAIRDHQVVSWRARPLGQDHAAAQDLPRAGRGVRGLIGHPSPAGSPPARWPSACRGAGTEVGGTVGYAVRFTDEVGPESLVKP